MPKKPLDELSVNDRVMALTGSINLRDHSALEFKELCDKFLNLLDSWTAIKEYYFIFHDETETYHVHYILIFNKQQYVKTCVNKFCECFNIEVEAVNYKKLLHRNAMLRYIIHQDSVSVSKQKKRYESIEIFSNINQGLVNCFINSKSDDNKLDMLTLEGICVQCGGNELLIAEFLDELYDKNFRKIQLILNHYSVVRLKFDDLPF